MSRLRSEGPFFIFWRAVYDSAMTRADNDQLWVPLFSLSGTSLAHQKDLITDTLQMSALPLLRVARWPDMTRDTLARDSLRLLSWRAQRRGGPQPGVEGRWLLECWICETQAADIQLVSSIYTKWWKGRECFVLLLFGLVLKARLRR